METDVASPVAPGSMDPCVTLVVLARTASARTESLVTESAPTVQLETMANSVIHASASTVVSVRMEFPGQARARVTSRQTGVQIAPIPVVAQTETVPLWMEPAPSVLMDFMGQIVFPVTVFMEPAMTI